MRPKAGGKSCGDLRRVEGIDEKVDVVGVCIMGEAETILPAAGRGFHDHRCPLRHREGVNPGFDRQRRWAQLWRVGYGDKSPGEESGGVGITRGRPRYTKREDIREIG